MFLESKSKQFPTYLVRNPYSYCFRMNVPKDLQPYVGKKELRYSLKTGYLGIAKQKASLLAVGMQRLFRQIRSMGDYMTQLDPKRMQEIINRFIRTELERTEIRRANEGYRHPEDIEEEYEWFKDSYASDSIDLREGWMENISRAVEELLKANSLTVDSESKEFKTLCRKLLIARTQRYKVEMSRVQADYSDDIKAMFPLLLIFIFIERVFPD